jgi:hypothetical protein
MARSLEGKIPVEANDLLDSRIGDQGQSFHPVHFLRANVRHAIPGKRNEINYVLAKPSEEIKARSRCVCMLAVCSGQG